MRERLLDPPVVGCLAKNRNGPVLNKYVYLADAKGSVSGARRVVTR